MLWPANTQFTSTREYVESRGKERYNREEMLIVIHSSTVSHSRSAHQEPSRRSRSSQLCQWYAINMGDTSTPQRSRQDCKANSDFLGHIRCSSRSSIEQEGLGGWYQGMPIQTARPHLKKAKRRGWCQGEALQLRSSGQCQECEGFTDCCC